GLGRVGRCRGGGGGEYGGKGRGNGRGPLPPTAPGRARAANLGRKEMRDRPARQGAAGRAGWARAGCSSTSGRSSGLGPGRVLLDVGPVEPAGPGPGAPRRRAGRPAAASTGP